MIRSSAGTRPRPLPSAALVEVNIDYAPRGAARELFHRRDPELVLSGPAGTGKSRGVLEKLHLCATKYAGMRGLMLRKELSTLTATGIVTYTRKVLHELDHVHFFGGSARESPQFRYPNGSSIVIGGLDKPRKIMSSEYDVIFAQEATELTEGEWETLTTRLRNGVMPYQQLLGDCNPDVPAHWLKRRADRGQTTMLESRHEDNPSVTPEYLAVLDSLTGVRRQRLRLGLWVAAEGMVYEGWDRALHLRDAFPIPADWPRYWSIDFGFTNPLVIQWWAEDPDGRFYRYRELYRTQLLVEDAAREALDIVAPMERPGDENSRRWREPKPRAIYCDHDAEDRATFERHIGMRTTAAYKLVSPGIQAVASRLKVAGDGQPRLFLLRGAAVRRDEALEAAKLPASTEEEIEGYVWDLSAGRRKGEQPLKENDHGVDALRYLVGSRDPHGKSYQLW